MAGLVLVLEDDLLFGSRVEGGLRASAYRAQFVTDVSELSEALKAAPVLLLVNADSQRVPWEQMVAIARERGLPPHPSIVAYGSHVNLALRQQALDAGCDAFVARSMVANNMSSLLAQYAWKPDLTACDHDLPSGIVAGLHQFNRREFYACHDTIELVWMDEPGDVRLLYQGILQISVAFHQAHNGNWPGMVKMLSRGKGKLLLFLPRCQGIDVAGLLDEVERAEKELRELGPRRVKEFDSFPQIQIPE